MDRPDEAGRQVHQHRSPLTAIELQEDTTMAKKESDLVSESPKLADLLHQLREALTPEAQRDVMVKTILAGRNNEISVTEGKVLNMEFVRINSEAQARLKEERARLKTTRRTAD
jgi:hypothetical protein